MTSLLKTYTFLAKNYPKYLYNSPFFNMCLISVPHRFVKTRFRPEEKLEQIRGQLELDTLQRKLVEFTELLTEESGVHKKSLGVTGSILLDIHNPQFSDMDVTVYDIEESYALKETLTRLADWKVKRLTNKEYELWCKKKAKNHPITVLEAKKIFLRKWNIGVFQDTYFSVLPVKVEAKEKYGDRTYRALGQTVVRARVEENKDAIFLPAVYRVNPVEFMKTLQQKKVDVREVVSYESLYDNLADIGEIILVKGILEEVIENRSGKTWHRVLVGSLEGGGQEYVKLA